MNEYEEHKDHLQASSDALSKFLDSEEGKEFLRNFDAKKKRIKEQLEKRFLVFEKWLKTNDFDKLMYRLINKHGEDYCRRCYDKGYEPHPNNVLGFVISYVFHRTPEVVVDELLCDFTTFREIILKLNLKETGGNYKNLKNRCNEFNIDYSHFVKNGWRIYGHPSFSKNTIPLNDFFIIDTKKKSSDKVKKRLLNNKLKEYKCEECGIDKWQDKYIVIELHHINGNNLDNRLINLKLLCPNCHSQTFNYCKGKKIRGCDEIGSTCGT